MWDGDVASRSLGMELVVAEPGSAVVRMPVTDSMINGHDVAHGGYLFLLADSAFACACNGHGPVTLAAGADITFVAPVRRGDMLEAHARERVRFGRSGVYDVTVFRGEEIVAEFRGRSRTTTRRTDEGR
ncbi:MAG TPA: hydroxyphenylacetyl-CoA thioesterase PaaI [Actinophytocola sp.]|uniref:hydroxyphenylacetyl-CoA thioesterase PaaI n=1 Tax=Actinophytocola sp. TaxID=1872138 RepID=UPI002DBE00B3|nr:hydroxyphenylacetyl-CoA thioesterase PaaI [Actinophytocola sp.]HEU5470371.1 hydroxyphenylacetyl-CoA thioesterase PaaI [Actinophytocola sp.]